MRHDNLSKWAIAETSTIRDIVELLNAYGLGTVFLLDVSGRLVASATDGDVRRALLAGESLESAASSAFHRDVLALVEGADAASAKREGFRRGLTDFPIVDSNRKLVGVWAKGPGDSHPSHSNLVVIMAGGEGLRLRPLTEATPKPLLNVGGKPILQHIVENLRDEGFLNIVIAVNYLAEQIRDYFGDGSNLGVSIRYLEEDRAMGTAGALSLLGDPGPKPIVVMNGDLVVAARIAKLVEYHVDQQALITVGAKIFETTVPFGVFETSGPVLESIVEKPTRRELVNTGIYILDPSVVRGVSSEKRTEMPDVIAANISTRRVLAFPIHETWADLGHPDDFARANDYLENR